MSRPDPAPRSAFRAFRPLQLRWHDNDIYGHMNNSRYHDLFDTAVNGFLLEAGALSLETGGIFLVVSNACDYFSELGFPMAVEAGLRVDRLGGSSVTYGLGLFALGAATCAAQGRFVHVQVDRVHRRPLALSETQRTALAPLVVP